MSPSEIGVLVATLIGIALVNWFFFGQRSTAVATRSGSYQQVTIQVKGGYDPAVIQVHKGEPVRLIFDRQETSSCSEEVVFPDFSIKKYLPAFEQTAVELEPKESGTYEFTCGMSMLRGKLIVE